MGFRINPRGVDKNKRNTESKQAQNKTNASSVDDKIKQYFNSLSSAVLPLSVSLKCRRRRNPDKHRFFV